MYTVAQLAADSQYSKQSRVVWGDADSHGKVDGCGVKDELCQAVMRVVI